MNCPYCTKPVLTSYWGERDQHCWYCQYCGARGPWVADKEKVFESLQEIHKLREFHETIQCHVSYVRETRINEAQERVKAAQERVKEAECLTLARWLGENMR